MTEEKQPEAQDAPDDASQDATIERSENVNIERSETSTPTEPAAETEARNEG